MWDTNRPAWSLNGTGPDGGYEEAVFTERALSVIAHHPASVPLYLYYALHTSCIGVKRPDDEGGVPGSAEALQPPRRFYDALRFIDNEDRRRNHAMVAFMDEAVANISSALKVRGLWDRCLLIWQVRQTSSPVSCVRSCVVWANFGLQMEQLRRPPAVPDCSTNHGVCPLP